MILCFKIKSWANKDASLLNREKEGYNLEDVSGICKIARHKGVTCFKDIV